MKRSGSMKKISKNGKVSLWITFVTAIVLIIAIIFMQYYAFSGVLILFSIVLCGVNLYVLLKK